MGIDWEKGVHLYTWHHWHQNKEYLGEPTREGKYKPHFYVGHYSFGNPYSANMYSYLFTTYGPDVAKSVVQKFEKKLVQNAAGAFWELTELDWESIFKLRVKSAVDVNGTVVTIVVRLAGWAYHQLRLGGALAAWNPNSPSDQGDADGYIQYAVAYWSQHPGDGPAYRVLQK